MRPGITELAWRKLTPDQQQTWEFSVWLVGIICSLFTRSTHIWPIDLFIKLLVGFNIFLLIGPQRKLSTYSISRNKLILKTSAIVFMIGNHLAWSIILISVLWPTFFRLYTGSAKIILSSAGFINLAIGIFAIIFAAKTAIQASFAVIKSLRIIELVFVEPKKLYIPYLTGKTFKADSIIDIGFVEVCVIIYSYLYSYIISKLITDVIHIIKSQII